MSPSRTHAPQQTALYSITLSARASIQSASRDAVPWRVSLVLKAPLNENPNYRGHRRTPRDAGRRVPVPRPRRQEEASQRATVGVEYPPRGHRHGLSGAARPH